MYWVSNRNFFTSKYSFSSGVGYVMHPILLVMWTAFQSFILRDNNIDDDDDDDNDNNDYKTVFKSLTCLQHVSSFLLVLLLAVPCVIMIIFCFNYLTEGVHSL